MSTLITQTVEIVPDSPYVKVTVVGVEPDLPPLEAYATLALFAADGEQLAGHKVSFEREDNCAIVIAPGSRSSVAMYIVPDEAVRHG